MTSRKQMTTLFTTLWARVAERFLARCGPMAPWDFALLIIGRQA